MFKNLKFEEQKIKCYLILNIIVLSLKRTFINGKKSLLGNQILIIIYNN